MDENLKQLARQLRKETCPQRVLDEVERRRAASTRHPTSFRHLLVGVAGTLAILCLVLFWPSSPVGDTRRAQERTRSAKIEGERIAREAEGALGYIGSVLLDAGAHSGSVILKGAVLPLQDSVQTARQKITDHI